MNEFGNETVCKSSIFAMLSVTDDGLLIQKRGDVLLKVSFEILNRNNVASILQKFFAGHDVGVRTVGEELNDGFGHTFLVLSQRGSVGTQKRDQEHKKLDFG